MPSLRPAKSADLPAVVALIDAAYRHYVPILGRRPRPMDDDQQAQTTGHEVVAEALDLTDDDDRVAEVQVSARRLQPRDL